MTGDMVNVTVNGNRIESRISGDAHLMPLRENSTYKHEDFLVTDNRANARWK